MRHLARVLSILGVTGALTGVARAVPVIPSHRPLEPTADSIKVRVATPRAPPGPWTVEAADVASPLAADSLLRWLVLRGYDARVVGQQAPFRVRIGHFPSKRDAMDVARRLLRPGWTPFVTEARQ